MPGRNVDSLFLTVLLIRNAAPEPRYVVPEVRN
jgi:hypothetical protein